ncbi:MAG: Fur family transcriptional regulator [Candidatus Kryptoniota bacterium]
MNKSEAARQKLQEYLKAANYRITPERFEVLDYVMETDGHFDADELFLKMKNSGSKVSRATVYNTLDVLEECGLVFRSRLKDHGSRFERAFGRVHHDHLVCIECGKIVEFVDESIENAQEAVAKSFKFKLISHSHQIFGICPECQKKAQNS